MRHISQVSQNWVRNKARLGKPLSSNGLNQSRTAATNITIQVSAGKQSHSFIQTCSTLISLPFCRADYVETILLIAGHTEHEHTPDKCMNDVFLFLEKKEAEFDNKRTEQKRHSNIITTA
jgi:hypothetical protein